MWTSSLLKQPILKCFIYSSKYGISNFKVSKILFIVFYWKHGILDVVVHILFLLF